MFLMTLFGEEKKRTKLEKLYHKHKKRMFWEAYKVLSDKSLSEDAVSESFYRVAGHLDKLDEKEYSKNASFLTTVCRNIAINIKKKHSKEILDGDMANLPDIKENAEDIVIEGESVRELADLIKSLKPVYRDVIILKYAHGLKNEEIAKLLEISIHAVEKRISRAKGELSKKLQRS